MAETAFVASISDIKYYKDMPEEFLPFVHLKASLEGRKPKAGDRIAILNVSTTTSFLAIFLDKGKTIEDIEKEVKESSATLNKDSRTVLKDLIGFKK